jgi:hypothetical protein
MAGHDNLAAMLWLSLTEIDMRISSTIRRLIEKLISESSLKSAQSVTGLIEPDNNMQNILKKLSPKERESVLVALRAAYNLGQRDGVELIMGHFEEIQQYGKSV